MHEVTVTSNWCVAINVRLNNTSYVHAQTIRKGERGEKDRQTERKKKKEGYIH